MSYTPTLDLIPKQQPSLKQTQRMMMTPQMQQAIQLLQLPVMELAVQMTEELERNPVLEESEDHEEAEIGGVEAQEAEDEDHEDENSNDNEELQLDEYHFEVLKQLDDEFRDQILESSNPYLGRNSEEEKRRRHAENSISAKVSLFEHLMNQAKEAFEGAKDYSMAEALIGNLDAGGYLTVPLSEIALMEQWDEKQLKEILATIQTFDPLGVGARNLQESLLIQLRCSGKGDSLAYRIVSEHYEDLVHNRIPVICRVLKCTSAQVLKVTEKEIAHLDFHPGTSFSMQDAPPVIPDVTIKQDDTVLHVVVNNDALPSFRLNRRYLQMLDDESLAAETREFIKHQVFSAKWLMRTVFQRSDTLERIAESLAKRQKEFFLDPEGKLIPLTMKVLADELNLHESTVARAVANKYIDTPKGIFPLRFFFTNAYTSQQGEELSSHTVKDALKELITREDKNHPLSDQMLSKKMTENGIPCARRTVAKYRKELKLGNAWQRRQY